MCVFDINDYSFDKHLEFMLHKFDKSSYSYISSPLSEWHSKSYIQLSLRIGYTFSIHQKTIEVKHIIQEYKWYYRYYSLINYVFYFCTNYKGFLINVDDKALMCILLSLEMWAFPIEIGTEK